MMFKISKKRMNQLNQEKDAEPLKQLVKQKQSFHISFLETLNSEKSLASMIQIFKTSLLEDNEINFNILDEQSNRFEQVTSDIIFYQEKLQLKMIDLKDRNNSVSFYSETSNHIKSSQPLYLTLQQPVFTHPSIQQQEPLEYLIVEQFTLINDIQIH